MLSLQHTVLETIFGLDFFCFELTNRILMDIDTKMEKKTRERGRRKREVMINTKEGEKNELTRRRGV